MTQTTPKIRIGTRGSPLALRQAEIVRALLAKAHNRPESGFEIVALKTTGDRVLDRPLADAGGKGLFTKEIDEAQLGGRVDLGVHSGKDVPTFLPDGIRIAAFPEREDPRDVLIAKDAASLADLPKAPVVGTSSVRRQALVLRARPDASIRLLRGNVGTRLDKIARGEFDATILALAGLRRLDLAGQAHAVLDPKIFPPSVAQGAIAITVRTDDEKTAQLVAAITHMATEIAVTMERAFLAALDGSCRAPIGGHAQVKGERVFFSGLVIAPDGSGAVETMREGNIQDAEMLGRDAGEELRKRAPAGVLDA